MNEQLLWKPYLGDTINVVMNSNLTASNFSSWPIAPGGFHGLMSNLEFPHLWSSPTAHETMILTLRLHLCLMIHGGRSLRPVAFILGNQEAQLVSLNVLMGM